MWTHRSEGSRLHADYPANGVFIPRRNTLLLAAQTGLRVSELISLDRDFIHLGAGAHVRCTGKGRKERWTPLAAYARTAIQAWLNEPPRRGATALFPNRHGGRLSADSVQSLLTKYVCAACERCPSLKSKRVSPHVLRHYLPRPTMSGSFRAELQTSEEQGGFLQKHPGHPT